MSAPAPKATAVSSPLPLKSAAVPPASAPTSPLPLRAPAAPPAPAGNRWRTVRIIKIVVNSGVGESGEPRTKAERVLQMVTRQKPVPTRSKTTNRDFGIRQGQEIGTMVTLRGAVAKDFLDRALDARDRQLDPDSIDKTGNFAFGIGDYTDFAGMKYDPEIGIRGMDICVSIGRAGDRIRERRIAASRIPRYQRVSREETRRFLSEQFRVTFLE